MAGLTVAVLAVSYIVYFCFLLFSFFFAFVSPTSWPAFPLKNSGVVVSLHRASMHPRFSTYYLTIHTNARMHRRARAYVGTHARMHTECTYVNTYAYVYTYILTLVLFPYILETSRSSAELNGGQVFSLVFPDTFGCNSLV